MKDLEQTFLDTWPLVVKTICGQNDCADVQESLDWLKRTLEYNVPHGKFNRGLAVVVCYSYFSDNLTKEDTTRACILGWAIELLQASFLVADDIMDGSETRRGQPCWYKVKDVGLIAVNDFLMLEHSAYYLIREYFGKEGYYGDLISTILDVVMKTTLGQCIDTVTSMQRNIDTYSTERYNAIVKYKTSFYSFFVPVASALIMCKKNYKELLPQVRSILLCVGEFFQIQDDMLDVFGDVAITGKVGTDIIEGKCSWLAVQFLENADQEQKRKFKEKYGKTTEDAEVVKDLLMKAGVKEQFKKREAKFEQEIEQKLKALGALLPTEPFRFIISKILKRNK